VNEVKDFEFSSSGDVGKCHGSVFVLVGDWYLSIGVSEKDSDVVTFARRLSNEERMDRVGLETCGSIIVLSGIVVDVGAFGPHGPSTR